MQQKLIQPVVSLALVLAVLVTFGAGLAAASGPTPPAASPSPSAVPTSVPAAPVATPTYMRVNPAGRPILLRQAAFQAVAGAVAPASGSVQHRRLPDREVLHFTPNFVAPVAGEWEVVAAAGEDLSAGVRLGALKSLTGTQEYDVPADLDFTLVGIYDRGRRQGAGVARLQPEPACPEAHNRGKLAQTPPENAPDVCLAINANNELNFTGSAPKSVDLSTYRLKVSGMVDRPLDLTMSDIQAMGSQSEVSLLICIGFFSDVAEWTGVPLSEVLRAAGAGPDYAAVRLDGMDGYFTVLDREEVDPANVILAYWANGEPLPLDHGYPLRAVVKGDYGSKWVKWVREIKVIEK